MLKCGHAKAFFFAPNEKWKEENGKMEKQSTLWCQMHSPRLLMNSSILRGAASINIH